MSVSFSERAREIRVLRHVEGCLIKSQKKGVWIFFGGEEGMVVDVKVYTVE